jgi:S-adenosylmethionine hydrolase
MVFMKKVISFASDFGLEDGSVGICKGVISRIDPELQVIDLSHDIPPQNLKYASLLLMRSIQYIPEGVLLAVIDPGVGTNRKAIGIQTDWGVMIGPDNGLLNLACATVGGAKKAFELSNENWVIPHKGDTFHGRDKFSPFAAGYASGQLKIEDFGEELELENLTQYFLPLTETENDNIKGEIIWIDHFGNSQTNISPEELANLNISIGDDILIKFNGQNFETTWCSNFQAPYKGSFGLFTDSWGMLSIFIKQGNAATLIDLKEGLKLEVSKRDSKKLKIQI